MKTITMVDIFGKELKLTVSTARRKPTIRKGYAAQPGTGPEGETCKTCKHCMRCGNYGCKRYLKCDLMRAKWTGGEGTDILAKSPACKLWEKPDRSSDSACVSGNKSR